MISPPQQRLELFGMYSRNNVIARRVYDLDGNLADDEYITENHVLMMYDPMIGEKQEV